MIASQGATPAVGNDGGDAAILRSCHHSISPGHLVRSLAVAGALAGPNRVAGWCGGRVPAGPTIPAGMAIVTLPLGTGPDGSLACQDRGRALEEARPSAPPRPDPTAVTRRSAKEDAMHPMFAELFLRPDDTLEPGERRRPRRARRSRQLRTLSAACGNTGAAPPVPARRQPP